MILPLLAVPVLAFAQGQSVRVNVDGKGRIDIAWSDGTTVDIDSGEARLSDGTLRRTSDAQTHEVVTRPVKDGFGAGTEITVHHRFADGKELRHVLWVYAGHTEAMVRLEADGVGRSNLLVPLAGATAHLANAHQSLYVPYDNDAYERYRSDAWDETSHEVGAVYDDASRRGLIVGSIDHDTWKTGVRFGRDGSLRATAGWTDEHTRDKEPHGWVEGATIRSPRLVLGVYADWRIGLERYGDLNAKVQPMLAWRGKVPFGWSSWSGHKSKVNAADARAATDFLAHDLPAFRSGGTAYLNLDSFWDNLKREERVAFVKHAHAAGLKAGIYWTPFVNWGEPDWKVSGDERYRYRDLALKDSKGEPLPKLDGGWPLDPTHPGTLARIDRQMEEFAEDGYDFVKLDFMTHGALEGRHFDPKIATGNQAYAVGMRRILEDVSAKRIGRPMFICLSIAPLFPNGYGHSRRISCDVFANIGASEYLLNSTAYAWWQGGRLYAFDDPDSACVYQPLGEPPTTEAEARTRFTASAITGGMMIEGDDLTRPEPRERAKRLFSNEEILALARKAPNFRPVDGDTGAKAGDAFVWQDRGATYVAAFNFDKTEAKRRTIPLARLGLTGSWRLHDLWTAANRSVEGELAFDLPPMDCALVRLERAR